MNPLQTVRSAAAWKGSSFDFRADAVRTFSPAQLDEIDAGLEAYERRDGGDLLDIGPASFPLPTVGPLMQTLLHDLRYGSGVILLRGLPRERYSNEQLAKIYFALGTHLGVAVPQSHQGELLGSVIDVSDADAGVRGYQAGGRQSFHTDGTACDIVSLMCLQAARSGGESRIVSAVAVHNALVERRPDLAQVFYDGFVYRLMDNDAVAMGVPPTTPHPVQVFARNGADFFCNLNGGDIRRAVERGDVELTDLQIEAYDEFQRIANSEEFYLDMSIGEGDIQFLNNRTLLHGRLSYEDHDEVARRRYMLRLWLEARDWPKRPARQVVMSFERARRSLARRNPRLEMPASFVAAKQAELSAKRLAGSDPPRLRPYQNLSMRDFAMSVRTSRP
ncbi:MAG: TauD/TfdA family dioxygenase [Rhodospirillales bacterium]|nr:TauD/TfdA family dioxygenase [Rhodospirillales bacterium]